MDVISLRNPAITATAIIITAVLTADVATAIRCMTLPPLPPLDEAMREAMKNSVFRLPMKFTPFDECKIR
ncbi:MAG: hypothetical protein L6V35_01955 [Alistipes putredinis]|nr:MAG: hypothetical protein L6V35_01955 [Alistipes putredinis]